MEHSVLPTWAVRIRREREGRGLSVLRAAEALMRHAAADEQHGLPSRETVKRRWHEWEAGEHVPGEFYQPILARMFGLARQALFPRLPRSDTVEWPRVPSSLLASPAFPADSRSVAAAAAHQSLEFLAWAQADRVAPAVLEYVSSELRRIAIDYVHKPLAPLLGDLMVLRDTAFGLLKDRPHPRQSRELFFVAGTVCTLLAHASQNLGSSSAARAQAATAWTCAEQADHCDLRAWVRGTQALIEEWTDHYDRAVALARQGQMHACSAESMVRLAAIEARTLARAGDAAGAGAAVVRASQARERATPPDALAEFGGVLTFPHVKQLYYAGSTLVLVGRNAEAERVALEAIDLYETGPLAQRSYGDEALARVDVAIARAAGNDLDGAQDALEPVFNLPAGQRIQQIASGLDRVRLQLALPHYTGSPTTGELIEGIEGFAERNLPG